MNKTPTKETDTWKELTVPNRDSPGISKTVYTHIANLHNLLNNWVRLKDTGTKICKSVSALRLHECTDDYYPHQLQPLMEALLEAYNGHCNIVEGIRIINKQLQALSKLDQTNNTVIFTWTVQQISNTVNNISESLEEEIDLKKTITETLAHCRDENEIDVYVSAWEAEPYYKDKLSAYLFAGVGLTAI